MIKQKQKKEKRVDNGNERKITLLIITLRTFVQVFGSYSSVGIWQAHGVFSDIEF